MALACDITIAPYSTRILDPKDESYPQMIELFSRRPDLLTPPRDAHLVPVPTPGDAQSLSAILMSDDYYQLVIGGRQSKGGVTVAQDEEYITDEQFNIFRTKIFEVIKILNGYIKYLKNRKMTE